VLLACSGLEHAHRGYESFARECFAALRDEPGVAIELVKGSGPPGDRERSIPTLTRERPLVRRLAAALGVRAFRLEFVAFGASLAPLVLRRAPDLVYLSEWDTARVLSALRAAARAPFKILLSNGGFAETGFARFDHVQELTPGALERVVALGADPRRHTLLPMGFAIAPEPEPVSEAERAALRARLGLPAGRPIVVSVAALNSSHKRLDHLVEAVAALPAPRPFLVMDGERDGESAAVAALARARLGEQGYELRTSPSAAIRDVLRAADLFALASLAETQGRALIEAMAAGVECVAHDSPVTRFALGEHGLLRDLTRPGELTRLLREALDADPAAARARLAGGHRHVYERFSWDRLRPAYVELLTAVARGGAAPPGG
jgi:1,2-diacylglycerol 3-alpha-glucosyltransferase